MIKNNILYILLLCVSITFSQKKYQKSYFNNGIIKEEGWTVDSLKNGYWIYYHSNGTAKEKGHFVNGEKDGYWYSFFKTGIKESEGHFISGGKNKWWIFYDKKGNIIHKCQMKHNLKNGYCLLYKDNKLIKASKFVENKKLKEWKDFSSFKQENNLSDLK